MFKNKQYITHGVNAEIPLALQLFCWSLITKLRKEKRLDYMQIFQFSNENGLQIVEHIQEQPDYSHKYILRGVQSPLTVKLLAIDDGDHSTLMLADEY